ncbi:hypothetical protein EV191_1011319 [Tamaricihabitans halophyticus]|uniref:Uncharacterized protein n=1 Tax=Tamaricihabitans halophyticus TaxID=1262583 RepID=A0A4R2R5S2_9PSEU|nr:hypothetical protein [Tamaricihabitans halophyticus]TCP57364.1 hypothetical protein EV191_1011319 [Tamaricihabitans halophyticus]
MTVVKPSVPTDSLVTDSALDEYPPTPRVEATSALDWHAAVELPDSLSAPISPAQRRRAWIHRAPEGRVVDRYRESGGSRGQLPAPWWLRALATGTLHSRAAGFAIEDAVSELLDARQGWEYVPWVADAESGYWEYLPSESGAGLGTVPTTVLLTHRHTGWIDVVAAYTGTASTAIPFTLAELRNRIGEVESLAAN